MTLLRDRRSHSPRGAEPSSQSQVQTTFADKANLNLGQHGVAEGEGNGAQPAEHAHDVVDLVVRQVIADLIARQACNAHSEHHQRESVPVCWDLWCNEKACACHEPQAEALEQQVHSKVSKCTGRWVQSCYHVLGHNPRGIDDSEW